MKCTLDWRLNHSGAEIPRSFLPGCTCVIALLLGSLIKRVWRVFPSIKCVWSCFSMKVSVVILSLVVLLYSALILLVPEDILIKNKACTIFFICHLWDNKPSIFSYAVKVYICCLCWIIVLWKPLGSCIYDRGDDYLKFSLLHFLCKLCNQMRISVRAKRIIISQESTCLNITCSYIASLGWRIIFVEIMPCTNEKDTRAAS